MHDPNRTEVVAHVNEYLALFAWLGANVWLEADLARRQEIQTALFPDGLVFSPDFLFFEPRNHTLMQSVSELVSVLINDGRGERI